MARAFARTDANTGQYIDCGNATSLNPANNLSLACWVRFTSLGVLAAQFMISRDGPVNRCYSIILQNYQGTRNTFLAGLFKNNTTASEAQGTTVAVVNTWYHVASTYKFVTDGTSELRLYVNGTEEKLTSNAVGPVNQATATNELGRRAVANNFPLDGQLAEAAIYDVTLDAAEVAALARGVSPRLVRPQGLRLYAPLIRDIMCLAGNTLTNNSTTVANHPRVYA